MPSSDYWEDEWYASGAHSGARHVHPRKARDDGYGRRTSEFLNPEAHYSTSLHRTRSQGHAPTPNVTIYNTTRLDNESNPNVRTDQRSRDHSPRGRTSRRMPGEWALEDEIAEVARLEISKQRARSKSAHHYHHDDSPDRLDRWKLDQANQRLREQEERMRQEEKEELLKRKLELKYVKDRYEREAEEARIKLEEERLEKEWELKHERAERDRIRRERDREDERRRIIAENTAKLEKEERERQIKADRDEEERKRIIEEDRMKTEKKLREAKAAEQRAVDDYNKRKAEEERERKEAQQRAVDDYNKRKAQEAQEAKEAQERVIAEYERKKVLDAAKAKKEREELLMQIKIEEEKQRQKDKEEYEAFLLKQKQIEADAKAKKEKEEQELEDAMRKRLAQFGFQENQIQAMIKPEEAEKLRHHHHHQGLTPLNPLPALAPKPVYVKVHRQHLATDTLHYYDIPYEIDASDPNYIIVLREMEPKETEILFEHTRRLRSRTTTSTRLLIEERGGRDKPNYAFVRRKSRSRSRVRADSSPKRVVGIKEMFF